MNKLSITATSICAVLLSSTVVVPSHAGELKLTWKEPTSFTDVRPSNESRARFRERTLKSLEAHLVELAATLPKSQTLSMVVTNIDLAGQVWPSQFIGFGNNMGTDVRVIQRVDIPRMTFSYSLTDSSGEVLKSEENFQLKDMGFMDTNIRNMRNENLFYEKAMLDDWFDDTFSDTDVLKNEGE